MIPSAKTGVGEAKPLGRENRVMHFPMRDKFKTFSYHGWKLLFQF